MEKIGAKESRKNKKKKMTASDVVLIVIFVVAITVAAVSGYKLYSIMKLQTRLSKKEMRTRRM